ncbi:phospholipase A and acyltransferase 4-like isoform X2 [Melanotaenia boesemani]|uniref:phospholipase A and acyltransferase 4-like isoform X2 n=1 Tax=Melanotaenia boesemani TaxID=1250792 RepID=UPI001C03B682|nr:phospholipase A and acyltransferase 4-like isoform X2 [Melanotaenia boesemani]XP_041868364.1 phospholipase A and acyltransferase 4-like isoform X2 [Melanotaenia boesemani]
MNKKDPELGDLIEIYRGAYNHWAVYVGDGYVVDFVETGGGGGSSSSSGSSGGRFLNLVGLSTRGKVRKEKLREVVNNDPWIVNNSLDAKCTPRKPHEIVSEARKLVGKKLPYNFITNNCEHFAKDLRYGTAVSEQVEEVERDGVAGAVAGLTKRFVIRNVLDAYKN